MTKGPSPDVSVRDLSALAGEAYIFGFPALELQRLRYNFAYAPNARRLTPLNTFRHIRVLATPNSREVTTPNNDTIYSSAWLDLSAGPVVLSTPGLGDRYYSYAFMDFFSNVFAIAGRRNAPGGGRRYMIVGPGWSGRAPSDMALISAPTNAVWLLARFLVDGPDDLPAVRRLQDESVLDAPPMPDNPGLLRRQMMNVAAATEENVESLFEALNSVLAENPPRPCDAPIMERLAAMGVGPGLPFAAGGADRSQALMHGVSEARNRLKRGVRAFREVARPGDWSRPPMEIGDFKVNYLLRGVTALAGLAALPPEEAMYLATLRDSEGAVLNGANAYVLRFENGGMPPAKAFWSLTMYEIDAQGRSWLVKNDLRRYSIGDRTPGLRFGADGALEIRIRRDCSDPINCLPAPAGPFMMSLRVYEPGPGLLDGRYSLPPVVRVA